MKNLVEVVQWLTKPDFISAPNEKIILTLVFLASLKIFFGPYSIRVINQFCKEAEREISTQIVKKSLTIQQSLIKNLWVHG